MRWTPVLMSLFVIVLVGSFALDASARQDATGAPLVDATAAASATPTPLRSMRNESPLMPPVDEWTSYISESGGYTLEFPLGWVVNEQSEYGKWNTIVPPVRKRADTIIVNYLEYEKPEELDLQQWLIRYREIKDAGWHPKYEYEPVVLSLAENDTDVIALHEFVPDAPYDRSYYLINGRLVLRIHTMGASQQQEEVLRRVAASVTFHDDAPSTILDISNPQRPPVHTTIAEFDRMIEVMDDASAALAVRMSTGETPSELLADPEVAAKYEQYVEARAGEIAFQDKNRETWQELLTNRPPTPNPTEIQLTQEAFQVIEDLYNKNVAYEATLEASKPTQPAPTISPLPTPTPTIIPDAILADTADRYPGLTPLVRKSHWDSVKHAMLVWYDPQIWQQTKSVNLTLAEDPACKLNVEQTSESYGMPYSAQWLAGQEWTVLWSWDNSFSYEARQADAFINARLYLPHDQEYRETDKGQCQRLAEDVLDTTSVVPAELLQ